MAHPPLRSKYTPDGPTEYELAVQRRQARNEKARLRMASKRAELRTRPLEEQAQAAEINKKYQATYREKNRRDLRIWEAQRRAGLYMARYGPEAYREYDLARRECKLKARRKQRTMAKLIAATAADPASAEKRAAQDRALAASADPTAAEKRAAAAEKRALTAAVKRALAAADKRTAADKRAATTSEKRIAAAAAKRGATDMPSAHKMSRVITEAVTQI
ncbi:hypothetical protein FB451DRAFT_1572937 [Mycena latifolia]|nr:hypothetical protein FB451DRAFT_1572937 [Mycena latifolia]